MKLVCSSKPSLTVGDLKSGVISVLYSNNLNGDDGIPPGVFKALDSTLIEILAFLLNNVMRSGEYPNCWSTDIIDG